MTILEVLKASAAVMGETLHTPVGQSKFYGEMPMRKPAEENSYIGSTTVYQKACERLFGQVMQSSKLSILAIKNDSMLGSN